MWSPWDTVVGNLSYDVASWAPFKVNTWAWHCKRGWSDLSEQTHTCLAGGSPIRQCFAMRVYFGVGLQCVSYTVPATVLRSRAESTTKKYLGAYQRWRTWADARQGVPSFPVQGASSGAVRVGTSVSPLSPKARTVSHGSMGSSC